MILSFFFGPRGTSTLTTSLRLWPISALPIGDSLESLCSSGSASVEPTIWNFCESPDFWSLTWTIEPKLDLVGADFLLVDHGRAAQPLLELGDPLLEQRLLVLGVVVLGVLGDVAELARLLDPLGDLAPFRGREVLDLLFELLEPFRCDYGLPSHFADLAFAWSRCDAPAPRPKNARARRSKSPHLGRKSRDYSEASSAALRGIVRPAISSLARGRSALRCSSSATSAGASSDPRTKGRTCAGSGWRALGPEVLLGAVDRPEQLGDDLLARAAAPRGARSAPRRPTDCRARRGRSSPRRRRTPRRRGAPPRRSSGRRRRSPAPPTRSTSSRVSA